MYYVNKTKNWLNYKTNSEKFSLLLNSETVAQKKQQYSTGLLSQGGKGAFLLIAGVSVYGLISILFGKQKQPQATSKDVNENKLSSKATDKLSMVTFEEFDEASNKFVPLSSFSTGRTLLSISESDLEPNYPVQRSQDLHPDMSFSRRAIVASGGCEFQVNSYTTNSQASSLVASLTGGGFVVVWYSDGQDGDGSRGAYGQRYDAGGAKAGEEFQVNSYTTSLQNVPSVAGLNDDGFVVVWYSRVDSPNYLTGK